MGNISHLRPGFELDQIQLATARMYRNVRAAIAAGSRVEYHVAAEEHLAYARHLPLPPSSMVVHPVDGRIAGLLGRSELLIPLLADLVHDLQLAKGESKRPAASLVQASEEMETPYAWDWDSYDENILLGRWSCDGVLSFHCIAGKHLALVCKEPPGADAWFCSKCRALNGYKRWSCRVCHSKADDAVQRVACRPPSRQNSQDTACVASAPSCDSAQSVAVDKVSISAQSVGTALAKAVHTVLRTVMADWARWPERQQGLKRKIDDVNGVKREPRS